MSKLYFAYKNHETKAMQYEPVLATGRTQKKRKPWNWGKRKPVEDDYGNKWCNCVEPKLVSNAGGRGQAYCLLCHTPWYH